MNHQVKSPPDLEQLAQDYAIVEKALRYLDENFRQQPSLSTLAQQVGLSEYHFQRLFTRWVGISPKRFLQFLTKEHVKKTARPTVAFAASFLCQWAFQPQSPLRPAHPNRGCDTCPVQNPRSRANYLLRLSSHPLRGMLGSRYASWPLPPILSRRRRSQRGPCRAAETLAAGALD